jgi:hypothetical protein
MSRLRSRDMGRLLLSLYVLLGGVFLTLDTAPAQDLPPPDTLRALAEKLPHRPQSSGTTFQPSGSDAAGSVGKMQRFTMTLATGSRSARSLPVLLDHRPAAATAPVTLLTVLRRVTVDADGSPRAYHPEDPHGTGLCNAETGPDGNERYSGVCALDNFFSGNIQVFRGTQKLRGADLESQWQSFWPMIRDKKLASFDLQQYLPDAPDGYYFFYWKNRGLSAFFEREIIPEAMDGYPCRHDGYFVAATTLKQDGAARSDGCTPSRFLDAGQIPFFVLPDDAFGNARLGDIVVARLQGSAANRVVYGIVGDTGPIAQFGEASIAFNQALLAKPGPIMNERDADAVDINGAAVTVLVLGGTRPQLHGNYSRQNIEAVGRREFARWNNDPSSLTRRLDVSLAQSGLNR